MARQKEETGPSAVQSKREALRAAIEGIEKKHGAGAIIKIGDTPVEKVPVFSTGCLSLDAAIGVGGVPRGRVIEIFGPEATGKTTVALHIIAEAQKAGEDCGFIDAEHALSLELAERVGVDVKNLYLAQPDCGEDALDVVESLVRSCAMGVIVVDSVSALTPRAEIEGEMGDSHMGLQARLMGQALRKLTAAVAKSNTTLIFINQLRQKIGVMFGNPETTTGGNALKFYASVRLDVRRIEAIKDKDSIVGNRLKIKVVKNKVAVPFKQAEVDIIFGWGIDKYGDLVDTAVAHDIILKGGAWYAYGGEKIGQGRDAAVAWVKNDPVAMDEIYRRTLEALKPKDTNAAENTTAEVSA